MYQYCRRCHGTLTGESFKTVRRSASIVFVGGLLTLAGGCEKSGDAAGASATNIATSDSTDGSASAPTRVPAIASAQLAPQTQPADPAPPVTLLNLGSTAQSTPTIAPSGLAPIEFDPPVVDVGYILPNQDKDATFQIRNLSDKPLKIALVKPSCTCTTLDDLSGTVIPPHSAVSLTAKLKGRSKASPLNSSITFLFEGYTESSRISLSAQVTRAIKTVPQAFNLASGVMSGRIVVESIDGRPFTIFMANREPPQYIGFDPETDEPRNAYVLEWDVSPTADKPLPVWWLIETDHPDCPVVDVWVRHIDNLPERVPGRLWRLQPQHFVVDGLAPEESAEFKVKVIKLGRDDIDSVISLSKAFNAELVSIERNGKDAEATVRITPVAGHQGLLYGDIEFLSQAYYCKLTVIGSVLE